MAIAALLVRCTRPRPATSCKRLLSSSFRSQTVVAFRSFNGVGSLGGRLCSGHSESPLLPHCEEQNVLACSAALGYGDRDILTAIAVRLQSWLERVYEALVVIGRAAEIALRLVPLAILTPSAMIAKDLLDYDTPANIAWWYALHTLQQLGPAFVKLAQWVATRRDMFPQHICDRFSKLHDDGQPHTWTYTDGVLREAFGDNYGLQLEVQSHDVIGCGSAAQVYRGFWRDDNGNMKPVAIKVLHPNFRHLVERDLRFMSSVANLIHSLPSETIRMVNLPRVAHNFSEILQRQADLRLEGSNLTRFRVNFYGQAEKKIGAVFFPKPLYSDEMILIEDLVQNAKPIASFLQDESNEGRRIRRELAGPLLQAFLKMVFLDNFVHCDLHPGNVLVRATQEPNNRVKRSIVFLDAGIAVSLCPQDQQNLKDLFRAVILNDGKNAGRLMVERAKYERCSQTPGGIDAFAAGVEAIVSEFHDNRKHGLTLGAVRIGSLLGQVLELCRVHGVEIDPAMASIVLSTLVLEGLGRSLEPDLNLIDFAIPFVLGRAMV